MTARPALFLTAVLLIIVAAHAALYVPSEPYFNNDETRHVMTGLFVRDMLVDPPALSELETATTRYYAQYPALGLRDWPPAFYLIEGCWMLLFGDDFLTARVLILCFALLAITYLFLLVQRIRAPLFATLTCLCVAFSPLVFIYSEQVMLEVPTLAWSLLAIFHYQRYLENERHRDLWLTVLGAVAAAMTRFDGIFLAPYFLFSLALSGKWRLLKKPAVWIAVVTASILVVPYYWMLHAKFGGTHLHAAAEGTFPEATSLFAPENFVFYPLGIPRQIGWSAVPFLLLGLASALRAERRAVSFPFFALMAAVYVTFTPMAEIEDRHAIYWIPALAYFSVEGLWCLAAWAPMAATQGYRRVLVPLALGATLLGGIGIQTWLEPFRGLYVRGYEAAAVYVVHNNSRTPICLFDGFLNGSFIYSVRRHDPDRRLWVLRGDKIFYSMLSDPHGGYREFATDREKMLELIERYAPDLIVIEEKQIQFDLPAARLLRTVLEDRTRFHLEETFRIDSNRPGFEGNSLLVYRNLQLQKSLPTEIEIDVHGLGEPIKVFLREK